MVLYSYKKNTKVHYRIKVVKVMASLFIFSGVILMTIILYPIINFELFYHPQNEDLMNPLPFENNVKDTIINSLPQILGTTNIDYTKASVWFPKANSIKIENQTPSYTLSIPKLNINKAKVTIGGEDLSHSLIHFTGPLPPNLGNPVIFGHSTLIWFYNPTDYKSIFTRLPDLKKNDHIIVTVDNITYNYQVFEMKVVYPDNVSVLAQKNDDSYITLITCVPPGTYFKRLIVRGKLIKI